MIRKLNKRDKEIINLTVKLILGVASIDLRKGFKDFIDGDYAHIADPLDVYVGMVINCLSNGEQRKAGYLDAYTGLRFTINQIKEIKIKSVNYDYFTYDLKKEEFSSVKE